MSNQLCGKRSFSLIELLIVVSIIAILVAMLLPALQQARQSAKRVVCAGNQKQASTACIGFSADNNRELPTNSPNGVAWYPPADLRRVGSPDDIDLVTDLDSYLGDWEVWKCPFPARASVNEQRAAGKVPIAGDISMFAGRATPGFGFAGFVPTKLSQATPTQTLLQDNVRDHRAMGLNIWVNHGDGEMKSDVRAPAMSFVRGANITFVDGHVKWYRGSDLVPLGNDHAGLGNQVIAWGVLP